MGQKKRTQIDCLHLPYLKKSDIETLFGCKWRTAVEIYKQADLLDGDELGFYRPITNKVRMQSVCKVTGYSYEQLKKIIERKDKHEKKNIV